MGDCLISCLVHCTVGSARCGNRFSPLHREFEPSFLKVVDESDGCGSKIDAIIVSEKFTGKYLLLAHTSQRAQRVARTGVALLARQRAVNECLAEEMPNIHAFTMKTWTPSQYEKKKASLSA